MNDRLILGWISVFSYKKWPFIKIVWEPDTRDGSFHNFFTTPEGWLSLSIGRAFPFLRIRWISNPDYEQKVFGFQPH